MKAPQRAELGRRVRRPPKIKHGTTPEWREKLAGKVSYTGNEAHKRNPGNFEVGARPRRDATLCDEYNIRKIQKAECYLKEGVYQGLVSERMVNGYPSEIWSINGEMVFEAQLENSEQGTYHGYPLLKDVDSRRQFVIDHWKNSREQSN